jgi:hypothetical protein
LGLKDLIVVVVGCTLAAERDDPLLLDVPISDARGPILRIQSGHRGEIDWSLIFLVIIKEVSIS